MTPKQTRFVAEYLLDRCAAAAARRAGYSARSARITGSRLLTKADIKAEIASREALEASRLGLSRQQVIAEIQRAITVAHEQANPMAQISGWREIAKMLGFYAPERREVKLSAEGAALRAEYEALSDEELLAIASGADEVE